MSSPTRPDDAPATDRNGHLDDRIAALQDAIAQAQTRLRELRDILDEAPISRTALVPERS